MILLRTPIGPLFSHNNQLFRLRDISWDELLNHENLLEFLKQQITTASATASNDSPLLPPISTQEVWAAGVTYYRSRDARMEESQVAGGGSFYDRVYTAQRPELFFKATSHRVVGHEQSVRIRRDSKWNVPEPELTLAINSRGKIIGYTIGNDMSSRDIEGENPLYLPQAKVYDGACALGPGILIADEPLSQSTKIAIVIKRNEKNVFEGSTTLAEMKRSPRELVDYLYRETSFPSGCFLMTGTGVVPPTTFTLQPADEIAITIDSIGTLSNRVAT
jgi:2-dehydro-3-deoxy-D-arabinonate dehydratase